MPCERDGGKFVLIDTAGIRRRARVSEAIEKYSIVQSLQAIEEAGAVIALLDAREGVTDQDVHLVGLAAERGRALVIARQQVGRACERAERRVWSATWTAARLRAVRDRALRVRAARQRHRGDRRCCARRL